MSDNPVLAAMATVWQVAVAVGYAAAVAVGLEPDPTGAVTRR